MIIQRALFKTLQEEIKNKKITAVTGSRQVGKTTALKYLLRDLPNARYISFDNISDLTLFTNNPDLFAEQYIEPYDQLIIDEFQYAPEGGRILKYLYDKLPGSGKIFISGSSGPDLAVQSLQYLAGRVTLIEVHPISFNEFLGFRESDKMLLLNKERNAQDFEQINNFFSEYLCYGGYPGVITADNKENELENFINIFLLKEIREILNYRNHFEFDTLLRHLATRDSQLLNISGISNEIGINRNKTKELLSILEKTYLLHQLQPFFNNKTKELIKSPKTYLADLGLKNALLRNFNPYELRQDKGAILESFILSTLIQQGKRPNFWNEANQHEMDFVLEEKGLITGIEVKSNLSDAKLSPSVKAFIKKHNPHTVYIFNQNIRSKEKYGRTKIIFTHYLNIFSSGILSQAAGS
jgi:uncharacterized protein